MLWLWNISLCYQVTFQILWPKVLVNPPVQSILGVSRTVQRWVFWLKMKTSCGKIPGWIMSTLGSMISWIRNFPGVAQGHYRHFLVGFVTSPWQVFRQQAISTSTVLCRKKNTVDSQVAGIRLGYIIQVIPVYNTIIQCLVWWFLWYYNSRNAHVRYHLIFGLYSQVLWLTFKHLAENRRLVAGFLFPSGQKWNHQKSLYHHVSPYFIHVLLQISWFIVYLDIVYP